MTEPFDHSDEVLKPFILSSGKSGRLFMFVSQHPEETRIITIWPGDYLNEHGVRFPKMIEWDGVVGGWIE